MSTHLSSEGALATVRERTDLMRIFLTGATGFIGGHLLQALIERGHTVTCLARGDGAARLEAMALPGARVIAGEFTRPEEWRREVAGHEGVINTVGIIRETPGGSFDSVHAGAPKALFQAAADAGVRKIVQLSALGADENADTGYYRTKGAADAFVATLGTPYVVLRPSLVYGPGDHSMTYFLSLAALPMTPVPGDGRSRFQPILVDDLIRALVIAVERDDLSGLIVDAGGARAMTLDETMDLLARWLGKRSGARKLHLPWRLMRLAAAMTDALGGRGPITGDELVMLRQGSCADLRLFVERFGFVPASFDLGMARRPRTEAVLWHARLARLRVPLRLSISFVWLAAGFVSAFLYPETLSRALLALAGLEGPIATVALYGASLLDIILGLATAVGWQVRRVGTAQLVVLVIYTALITATMPALWLHPFGALTKNIPLMIATLVMIALEE